MTRKFKPEIKLPTTMEAKMGYKSISIRSGTLNTKNSPISNVSNLKFFGI